MRKKVYNQFSWLSPEKKPEENTKVEHLLKESTDEKIDRRKVLNYFGVL